MPCILCITHQWSADTAGAMEMAAGKQAGWAVPRQPGALPTGASPTSPAASGVSAFAFQGTNAHAVLTAAGTPDEAGASISKPASLWARQRFWIAPRTHAALLCGAVESGNRQAIMQANLATAVLSYTWDHQVNGKALFPGTGFFELAAAAAKALVTGADNTVLAGVSIPAPLVLAPANHQQLRQPLPSLLCKVQAGSGAIEITGPQRSIHLRATLAAGFSAGGTRDLAASLPAGLQASLRTIVSSRSGNASAEPAYFAHIDDSAQLAKDVFLSPAVLDCCLHLGALPAAAAGQLKVPAGIQALLLPGAVTCADGSSYCAAALQVAASSVSSVIDYSLLAPSGPTACNVSGLLAKPLGAQQQSAAAAVPSSAAVEGSSRMLYEIQWVAAEVPSDRDASALQAGGFAASFSAGAGDAAALCSTGIAAFQAAVVGQLGSMRLQTTAAQPQLTTVSIADKGSSVSSLLWGMLRSVALEQTSTTASASDSDILAAAGAAPQPDNAFLELAAVTAALLPMTSEAYGRAARGGAIYSAALLPCASSPATTAGGNRGQLAAIKAARGRIAVTGGMGSLGLVLARWVEDAELATQLVLFGRTGRLAGTEAAASLTCLLANSAAAMTLAMADVAGSEGSSSALEPAAGSMAALTALFHSGGLLADATLAKQAPAGIRAVFSAKVTAAQRWQHTVQAQPAAAQVLFSSVAALLGSGGQTNYSAANAALDAMASNHQQKVGLPARQWHPFDELAETHILSLKSVFLLLPLLQGLLTASVQWGAWSGGGMAAQDRSTVLRVQRMGMAMIDAARGMGALHDLLSSPSTSSGGGVFTAVPFNWPTFIGRLGGKPVPSMFAAFADQVAPALTAGREASPAAPRPAARPVVAAPRVARQSAVPPHTSAALEVFKQHVAAEVAAAARSILGADVGANEPLVAAGLDSLSSVELRNSLEGKLGLELPSTLVFDYPTVNAISQFISTNHPSAAAAAGQSAAAGSTGEEKEVGEAASAEHLAYIQGEVAEVLRGILGGDVVDDVPLMSAGLDSLSSGGVEAGGQEGRWQLEQLELDGS